MYGLYDTCLCGWPVGAANLTECPAQSAQFLDPLAIAIRAGLSQPLKRALCDPENRLWHPCKVGDFEAMTVAVDTRFESIRVTKIPVLVQGKC